MKKAVGLGLFGALVVPVMAVAGGPPYGGQEVNLKGDGETTSPLAIYGDFRFSIAGNAVEFDGSGDDEVTADTQDDQSRLGLGGALGVDEKISVFYNISFYNDSNNGGSDNVRDYYAGARFGFGEVYAGKRRTVFAEVSRWVDPFYDTSTALDLGIQQFLDDVDTEGDLPDGIASANTYGSAFFIDDAFQSDQVGFRSASLGPVKFNVGLFSDDDSEDDNIGAELGVFVGGNLGERGHWGVSLNSLHNTGNQPTVDIAVDEFSAAVSANADAYKLGGGIDIGVFGVMAQLTYIDIRDASFDDEPKYVQLSSIVRTGDIGHVAVSVAWQDDTFLPDGETHTDGFGVKVGYFANISENLGVHAILSGIDLDDQDVQLYTLSLGATVHFDVGLI